MPRLATDGGFFPLPAYADTTPGENFTAEQSGSFVTLTLVPEPSSMLLGGIGSLLLLRRRRRWMA